MMEYIRKQCKQCKKWFHPLEIFLFYCHGCWSKRPAEMHKLTDRQEFKQCDECAKWVIAGHIAWDCQASAYGFLCVDCYGKKIEKDSLYRGTPFAFQEKAQ